MQDQEGQKETEVVKFQDLPLAMQLSIESLNASRRRKNLYAVTGRLEKCETVHEQMWAQYNRIVELVKKSFDASYTHVGVFKTGDLALYSDKKREGQTYDNGILLRIPI